MPVVAAMMVRLAGLHGQEPIVDLTALETDLFGPAPVLYGLVVERFGFVVGYALLTSRSLDPNLTGGLDLKQLFVMEGSRGLGLGRRLVDAALERARRAACHVLRVDAGGENARTEGFYRALGFRAREAGGQGLAKHLG